MNKPDIEIDIDGCKVSIRTNNIPGYGSWRCGYVTFPETDDLPGSCGPSAPVNGGLTYIEGRTLGWDYNHFYNMHSDTTMPDNETVISEAKELIAWVRRKEV